MNFEQAVVYDVETLPNVFTIHAEMLNSDTCSTWQISDFQDDRQELLKWFNYLHQTQTPMIGFNNEWFDYRIIHEIMINPNVSAYELYDLKNRMFASFNRFEFMIWQNKRFTPQIDLFKIHHFDNKNKTTSLKALQINMRSKNVRDPLGLEIGFDDFLNKDQIDNILIPYNKHDVKETKQFAHHSMPAINFRIGLIGKIQGDVLNFNDTKIGAKILENRLGEHICYEHVSGRKSPRQSIRYEIKFSEIIFPYVQFINPDFNRILQHLKTVKIEDKEIDDVINERKSNLKTKGVFKDLKAHVGGIDFVFGVGGIHGSVSSQKIISDENWLIRDIDVKSLYPSIAIVNKLSPEHLGEAFSIEYKSLLEERALHKKGTVENASLKLAANGTYGNSNNIFSCFYDPKFTLTITINGQLMLCMLAEQLMEVPTFQIIQINTDGITYRIHKDYEPQAVEVCRKWENYTLLKLEDADYNRMWIRDVNNYVAEPIVRPGSNEPVKLKQKGAYWHPNVGDDYANSISTAGPPAWHKDFNPVVVAKAAIAAMTLDIDPADFIRMQCDPFDFMLRVKVNKGSKLFLGDTRLQNTTRYFISTVGESLKKISPPPEGCQIGQYKRANKLTDHYFNQVINEIGLGVWDGRIHTKNKSKYDNRINSVNAGWLVTECNNADRFDFAILNYDFYIAEAKKLII